MIDKYKRPRAQRQVRERGTTALEMGLMIRAAEHRVLHPMREWANQCLQAMARRVLHLMAADVAMCLCAMPGEFHPSELRTDFI